MTSMKRILILALALAASACATAGGAGGSGGPAARVKQADNAPLGSRTQALDDEIEAAYYKNGFDTKLRGDEAARSGNMDQARAEWGAAAGVFAAFADKFPSSDWALRIRFESGVLYNQARQYDAAAVQLIRVHNDKNAAPVTKALSAKLLAQVWGLAANAAQKAGKLEPMRFVYAEQRAGKPPEPRVPPDEYKKFLEAIDLYLASSEADPDAKKAPSERQGSPPAYFAQVAGEVSFAYDNMQDAQRRFGEVINRWPDEAEFVSKAAVLYLQTFLVLGDTAGHEAALGKLRAQIAASAEKATGEEQKKTFAKILTDLDNANAAKAFGVAQKLLEEKKFAEAAVAFEAIAADPKGGDAPGALHNAAIAYDGAGQKEKAAALRQRILKDYPDSKIAPMNQIQLAFRATEAKKYDEAVKYYQEFLAKWPGDRNRCVALQNVASTYDTANKRADAAQGYLTFATDGECGKGDPNTLAKVLFRSGALFEMVKNKAKAKEAFAACVALTGVTNVVSTSQQTEAKNRLKVLK